MILLINFMLELIFILIAVAFFTLLERKILGYIHFRFGPNKVGYWGIFQPFSDALKLFSKENNNFMKLNYYLFFISPILGLVLMLMFWILIPLWGFKFNSSYSILIFFCITSMNIYFMLMSGWSGNSKYGLMGSYRSVAQCISYEVSFFLVFFSLVFFFNSYSFITMNKNHMMFLLSMWSIPLFFSWLIICLAESNRTPFDFSEGESELVSGFNTEYMGGLFSLIFIAEYGSILFFSFLTVVMFLNLNFISMEKLMLISSFYVLIRATLPRMRYDWLMMMSWKSILPFILGLMYSYFLFFFF